MAKEKLGRKARKGFTWDLLGSFVNQMVVFGISIYLARLLGPEEFGIIGMALAFIAIIQVFLDVGFTDGIIQKKEINNTILSSVFIVNLSLSLLLCLVILAIAPNVSEFYEDPKVGEVLQWLCLVPIIGALGKVHAALLQKNLDMRSLALRDVVASLIAGLLGLIFALMDFGVYSLVIQQVSFTMISTTLLWYSSKWRPKLEFSFVEVKDVMKFSGYVFADRMMRTMFQKLDTLFIGKVFSPIVLGFYSRAESLTFQVSKYSSSSLRKVIFPLFSELQDEEGRMLDLYFKVLSLAMVASGTMAGILFLVAEDVIILLLGNQWIPSIILFQVLIFRVVVNPLGIIAGKTLLAKGYSKLKFQITLLQRVLLLSPLLVGLYSNEFYFSVAVVLATFFGLLINMYMVSIKLKIDFLKQVVLVTKELIVVIIFVVIYAYEIVEVLPIVYAVFFLVIQFVYLYLTKSIGFKIALNEIKSFSARLLKVINVK